MASDHVRAGFRAVAVAIVISCGSSFESLRAETPDQEGDARRTALKIAPLDRDLLEQHPLWPAIQIAVDGYQKITREVRDYSCMMIRRERVDGVLQDHEYIWAQVRHSQTRGGEEVVPFSVYLKFVGPAKLQGREVLFVDGRNNGDLFARNGGQRFAFITTRVKPTSEVAMNGNRYAITEFGFANLLRRLIEAAQDDIATGAKSRVEFFRDAQIDGRKCTGVRVTHDEPNAKSKFYTATVFMDDELNLPVHYVAYDWPRKAGEEPILLEQYTYRDVRLNIGLTDVDFEVTNPRYRLQ